MYCPKCRTELPDDVKYCIKCGYDFTEIKTPPARKYMQDSLDGIGTSIQQEADAESFKIGAHFANRYEILSEGFKGGMGAVYKCRDTKLNKIKALKVIHPRLLSSQQALSRFRQEVAISQELQHENIVRVYDLEECEGKEYFTMEWVDGVSLREIITERKKGKRPFSIEEAYTIISQLADALDHAHKYTIHRDIKPENILVFDKEHLKVKLTDFGIAKMLNQSQFTSTSMQMGTPYYMAPEQKVDAANVDKRADIYALGVVLFELLTLENTIGLELPSELNKDLSKVIDNVIKKAVATKPEDRFNEVMHFSMAIEKLLKGSETHSDYDEGKSDIPVNKKLAPVSAIIGIVLIVALGVSGYIFFAKKDEPISVVSSQPSQHKQEVKAAVSDQIQNSQMTSGDISEKQNIAIAKKSDSTIEMKSGRAEDLKALINLGITVHPDKPNVALIIEAKKTERGISPESSLYNHLKTDKANIVLNYFKEGHFKSKGFLREIYDGNTEILKQAGAFSKINYIIIGKINYSFRKGAAVDVSLISCDITFSYRVINKNSEVVQSDSVSVTGPGLTEDAALERGLEIVSENYSNKIFKSIL